MGLLVCTVHAVQTTPLICSDMKVQQGGSFNDEEALLSISNVSQFGHSLENCEPLTYAKVIQFIQDPPALNNEVDFRSGHILCDIFSGRKVSRVAIFITLESKLN